jgi:hypothetical protein
METREDIELQNAQGEQLAQNARLFAVLYKRGTALARKNGYPALTGEDALCRYFADKYHWTPTQVRQLSAEDLNLLLEGV